MVGPGASKQVVHGHQDSRLLLSDIQGWLDSDELDADAKHLLKRCYNEIVDLRSYHETDALERLRAENIRLSGRHNDSAQKHTHETGLGPLCGGDRGLRAADAEVARRIRRSQEKTGGKA